MAEPRLYLDRRFVVNGKSSHIKLDNPVALHNFIAEYLKALPKYVDDTAAGTAGLTTGDLYWNTTLNTVTFKA